MYDDSNLKWGNNKNQRYNFRLSNTFHLTKNFDLESIISIIVRIKCHRRKLEKL